MAIQHRLTDDGLAVLALTSRWAASPSATRDPDRPTPFGPKEWARVARALAAASATPADLLGREPDDLAALLGDAPRAAEVIGRLASRATSLALEVERLAGRGIWLVSIADDAYPARLRDRLGESAPPILYGAGAVELLEAGGVAIVGARDADPVALRYASAAAAAVARSGRPVVSGGARGIDGAAMSGAAEAGGTVVGVVADSLERATRSPEVRPSSPTSGSSFFRPTGPTCRSRSGPPWGATASSTASPTRGWSFRPPRVKAAPGPERRRPSRRAGCRSTFEPGRACPRETTR